MVTRNERRHAQPMKSIHHIPLHLYSWDQFPLVVLSEVNKVKELLYRTIGTAQIFTYLCLFHSISHSVGDLLGALKGSYPTLNFLYDQLYESP